MKYKTFKYAALCFLGVSALISCKKVSVPDPIGDAGQTIIKVIDGGDAPDYGHKLLGVDFISTPQKVDVVQIYRDVPSNAELNKSMSVLVKDDTAAIRAYNTANGTNILHLPRAWYTSNITATAMGGTYTVPFTAGVFSQVITITINNASLMDPSSSYGLAFTLISNDGNAINSSGKTFIFEVGAKNAYDGVYKLTFSNYHPTSNPGYTGDVTTVHLVTTGAVKCKIFWPDAGGFYNPAVLGGSLTAFSAQEPEYTFDPATNNVTVQNAYSGATTFYTMNPSYNSHYDPVAKAIYAKWGYNYVGGTFDPSISREWTQFFEYQGPR